MQSQGTHTTPNKSYFAYTTAIANASTYFFYSSKASCGTFTTHL